jgi:hypothetical protein
VDDIGNLTTLFVGVNVPEFSLENRAKLFLAAIPLRIEAVPTLRQAGIFVEL